MFSLVFHLLDFRQGVLGFISLPLGLLQLNLIQLQLLRLLVQRCSNPTLASVSSFNLTAAWVILRSALSARCFC